MILLRSNVLISKVNIFKRIKRLSSTIFALSSAIKDNGSAIAVIRVSGVNVYNVLKDLTKCDASKWVKRPRNAIVTKLFHPKNGEFLDEGIVILFPKPHSYTGEDVCEFHIHGSYAVTSAMLKAIGLIDGCRHAAAGEFTKRAFINGKMNLIEAEGISDLITAKTDSQRRRALNAVSGQITDIYDHWRKDLLRSIAHLEANIDFGEDELIDDEIINNIKTDLINLSYKINSHVTNSSRKSDLIKNGLQISIIGEPNVGKSTFINLLSDRDLSIVSSISGTTRDIIETWININGYAVRVSDTAGIKDLKGGLSDSIEEEGIKRAIKRAKESHVILYVIDSIQLLRNNFNLEIPNYMKEMVNECNQLIYIINKIDLLSDEQYVNLCDNIEKRQLNACIISCKTRKGIENFLKTFTNIIEDLCGNPLFDDSLFTTERHETHLLKICDNIELALSNSDKDIAVCAHYLRQASDHISQITGKITTEHILDVIFKDFCIGK